MTFAGIFTNELSITTPGTFYLNGVPISFASASFSVVVLPNTEYDVQFVPDNTDYFTYTQTFYFPDSPVLPQFIGVLGLKETPAPICNFYLVQDKCTSEVFAWHAASSPYTSIEWTWWQNGEEKVTGSGGFNSHTYKVFGDVQISEKVTVCEPIEGGNEPGDCGCGGEPVPTNCTSCTSSQTFNVKKRIPELSLRLVCSETEESSIDCSCGCNEVSACKCIPINQSVVIKIDIAQNNEQCCYDNDFTINDCNAEVNNFTIDGCQTEPQPPPTSCFTELPTVYIEGQKTSYTLLDQTIIVNGQVDFSGSTNVGIFWQANTGSGWFEVFQTNYTNIPSPVANEPLQFGNTGCQPVGITSNLTVTSYTNGATIYSTFNLLSLLNISNIACLNGVQLRFGAQACELTQFAYSEPVTIVYQV